MEIKKSNLVNVFQFLNDVTLVGAASRARTKLNKDISEAINELQEEETTLAKEMGGEVDENGHVDFKVDEDLSSEELENAKKEKAIEFSKAQLELRQEKVIFNETVKDQFNRLKNALYNYDKELSGSEANVYDMVLDVLEDQ